MKINLDGKFQNRSSNIRHCYGMGYMKPVRLNGISDLQTHAEPVPGAGMGDVSFLRNEFEITTSNHGS